MPRIGKQPSKNLKKMRQAEKALSELRKQKCDKKLEIFKRLGVPEIAQKDKSVIHMQAILAIQLSQQGLIKLDNSLIPHLQEFVAQEEFPNFFEFLRDKYNRLVRQINEAYLKKVAFDPSAMFEAAHQLDPLNTCIGITNVGQVLNVETPTEDNMRFDQVPRCIQDSLVDRYVMHATALRFGLVKSSWTRDAGLDGLLAEIASKGPLVFNFFGNITLGKGSTQLAGREILQVIPTPSAIGHAFTVVGGHLTENVVYLVDPSDPSDPNNEGVQRFFFLDYEDFAYKLLAIDAISETLVCREGTFFAWASPYFTPFE